MIKCAAYFHIAPHEVCVAKRIFAGFDVHFLHVDLNRKGAHVRPTLPYLEYDFGYSFSNRANYFHHKITNDQTQDR